MTDYIVSGADLTAVANKIRSKGGTSAQLEFPTEFVSAIEAISGGGSTLGTKTITQNGTYNASSDSLDGYSQVTVNVSGGGSTNILSGTDEPTASVGSDGDIYLQYIDTSILPTGYSLAEYVEFSNSQYFDTGILASTTDLRIVSKLAVTNQTTEAFWGGSWAVDGFFFMLYSGKFRWHSGGKSVDSAAITTNQWYEIETNKSALIVDDSTYALSSPSGSDSANTVAIGSVKTGSQGSMAYMNLARTKIYSGSTLLADYVPAIDSNNVACLYDTVNQSTVYSAGNAFIAGSAKGDGEITGAFLKANGTWANLVGSNISDVSV